VQDLLDSAASWLAGQLRANAARSVTYRRGGDSVVLSATLGGRLLSVLDAQGNVKVERTDCDFVFAAADLVLAGVPTTPQRGDLIDVLYGAVTRRFEVTAPGREPVWRYADAHEYLVRVHAKYVGTV